MCHIKTLLFSFCGDIYFMTHISCLRVVAHSRVLGKIISVMYHGFQDSACEITLDTLSQTLDLTYPAKAQSQ